MAGDASARNVAMYDLETQTFSSLGDGLSGFPYALAALPDGSVAAGGIFAYQQGTHYGVMRWDGSVWAPLGSGLQGGVYSLFQRANGDLIAAGAFQTISGAPTSGVARWDGTAWTSLGAVSSNSAVYSVVEDAQDNLIIGGNFTSIGGVAANRVATLSGSTWSALGAGMSANRVLALAKLPTGEIVAGGDFRGGNTVAGTPFIEGLAVWNGTVWNKLGGVSQANVKSLAIAQNGDLFASGSLPNTLGVMARWNGTTWSSVPNAPPASCLAFLSNGSLIAGGQFGNLLGGIALWENSTWYPLSEGNSGRVRAMIVMPNGDLVVSGPFASIGGVPANQIARWNGSVWSPLGAGLGPGTAYERYSLVVMPNGDLVAGGDFTFAGGSPIRSVAKWDGTTWTGFGAGMTGAVHDMVVLPNGDLVVCGTLGSSEGVNLRRIARWNGSVWEPLGGGLSGNSVDAVAVLPNGDLIAGGDFEYSSLLGIVDLNNVARWNGTTWSSMSSPSVLWNRFFVDFEVLPNGEIVAATTLHSSPASPLRWNGTSWTHFATTTNGGVNDFAVLPNGDLIVAGGFSSIEGVTGSIAKWDGTRWAPLGSGITTGSTFALAVLPNGQLGVGGAFTLAGGQTSAYFARYHLGRVCIADASCSGTVTIDDLFQYINLWFAGDGAADLDQLNGVTIDDLFQFFRAWFMGC